jgi:uncharacterized protein YndB with AHSA1/START domain
VSAAASRSDSVSVSTVVAVDPERAFEVFTGEIDLWWRRGPRFRSPERAGAMRFEPGEGGRLVCEDEAGAVVEIGRVRVWKPAERLVFEWRVNNFEPGQTTEVEIVFVAVEGGTRVNLEHRGFDALPADHPVRHGLEGEAFLGMFGLWWADLLVALREHARRARERG